MDSSFTLLIFGFFMIAAIYASVGFGGGSSYLALFAIWGAHYETVKATGLICNIIVVTGGTYIFYKEGFLKAKKILPFAIASVPLAFVGGFWKISEPTFFLLLALALLAGSCLLWFQPPAFQGPMQQNTTVNSAIGGGVGLLSGLVGIGGGIFLSPILHLLRWDDAKRISAAASLFILANSVSGLAGQLLREPIINWKVVLPLGLAVLVGGQIGSRLGTKKFNPIYIKRITAILVLIAGINILKNHL